MMVTTAKGFAYYNGQGRIETYGQLQIWIVEFRENKYLPIKRLKIERVKYFETVQNPTPDYLPIINPIYNLRAWGDQLVVPILTTYVISSKFGLL